MRENSEMYKQICLTRTLKYWEYQDGSSQNVLSKFVRFFVTLGLKILILLWLKVVFRADIIKRSY